MVQNPLSDSPGWRSRGYIPHLDRPGLIQSVTIRLYDAVPESLIAKWKYQLSWEKKMPSSDPRRTALRRFIETYDDAGYGACWLKDNRIAQMVEVSLLRFDEARYRLLAWCVMPNHVHSIIKILEGFPLDEVLHSWKSFTAHQANKLLGRCGKFWFREYHDRYIRDEAHYAATVDYVENNPVKAKLVPSKEFWKWSSARLRSR
jgi:REP element-mobilizing transposase RayT